MLAVNRAKANTTTTGTGTVTLGSTVTPYQSWANAGAVNGMIYDYLIEDGTAWELGYGTYTSSGTTLSRTLVASSSGSLISLSGSATVACVGRANTGIQTMKFTAAGGETDFTFSNIPGGFGKIELDMQLRTGGATSGDLCKVQFNGDTGSNYDWFHDSFVNSGVFPAQGFGATSMSFYWHSGTSNPANFASSILLRIPHYDETTFYKNVISDEIQAAAFSSGNYGRGASVGNWRSTAAITSIKVAPNTGTLLAGSVAILRLIP